MKKDDSSTVIIRETETTGSLRYVLPKDLNAAIKQLNDEELDRLMSAALEEQTRRKTHSVPEIPRQRQEAEGPAESLPLGKVNAVRAAFKAGVTPARIAREFGLSQSDVRKYWQIAETNRDESGLESYSLQRSRLMLLGALDTLLMYHVSLCKIWVVTKRPSELLRLNQEHVCSGTSVIPRVPYAAVAISFGVRGAALSRKGSMRRRVAQQDFNRDEDRLLGEPEQKQPFH
jgi:transposase-like protein